MKQPNPPPQNAPHGQASTRPVTVASDAAPIVEPPGASGVQPQASPNRPARRTVRFEVDIPQARSISVVGTFNNWNPVATPLTFIGGTKWRQELSLPPGRYEYRFVLDGRWVDPPNAKAYVPNPNGGRNAVVEV